jgi:hypothetical protein
MAPILICASAVADPPTNPNAITAANRRTFILLSLMGAWPVGAARAGTVISVEDILGVKLLT